MVRGEAGTGYDVPPAAIYSGVRGKSCDSREMRLLSLVSRLKRSEGVANAIVCIGTARSMIRSTTLPEAILIVDVVAVVLRDLSVPVPIEAITWNLMRSNGTTSGVTWPCDINWRPNAESSLDAVSPINPTLANWFRSARKAILVEVYPAENTMSAESARTVAVGK